MSLVDRIDRYQRAHRRLGMPIAVLYKFFDDQGAYLAALITYYGVVSLFPLLLLLSTILNFVLAGNHDLQQDVLHSAFAQFPVVGERLSDPRGVSGSAAGVVVGILGTVYGGLGVAQAMQNAMNTIWRIPRNQRPNPIKSRGRSIVLLLIVGLALVATTSLSALGGSADAFGASVGDGIRVLLIIASMVINAVIFVMAFRVATARRLTVGQIWRGAVIAAIAWQVLQYAGTFVVAHTMKGASAVNGVFAIALGLIAWIYLESLIVVFASEYNVVREFSLYPRALLTPFTDNVQLTTADERAYTMQAKAQGLKGFQRITVRFDKDDET